MVKLSTILHCFSRKILWVLFVAISIQLSAQEVVPNHISDTTKTIIQSDSLITTSDSVEVDSVSIKKKSGNAITDPVDYKCNDSITFDLKAKKVYLYNNAEIHYQNITLKANYVESSFDDKTLLAHGTPDSNGILQGNPVFTEAGQEYKSKEMTYNFESKKGLISEIITTEGDGFIHGYKVKKADEKTMYMNGGCYTTCDLEHPHFALEFRKAKAIMGDRIITGPAYLSIEDVPTPLVIPFGFFPFTAKRTSGVLIPSYGYRNNRGFYFSRGGYYFALSDYYDLTLRGDIYTNLSWKLYAESNYKKRYKYSGNISITYEQNKEGIKETPSFVQFSDFSLRWDHQQDPKANPNSNFSASVEVISPGFGKWVTNINDHLKNTTASRISYSRKLGSYFNLNAGLSEDFNSLNKVYNFELPTLNVSSSQIFPFRGKKSLGKYKWYENIYFQYRFDAKNTISSPDSTLFDNDIWKRMKNGIQHSIPVKSSVRVFKYFNWDNGVNYTERWSFNSIRKKWSSELNGVRTDTVWGFTTNRQIDFNSSLNTRLYGMANFKSEYIKALRHTMSPSLSFYLRPDFGNPRLGFWKSHGDLSGTRYYSIFENALYGGPPRGESGSIGLSIDNDLEMKIRSKSDTITGTKKIVLIESFRVGMSYDFAKDSLNLSDLVISGRTTLFKNITINYAGAFSPYCIDSLGQSYNTFLWKKEGKLFKHINSRWDLSIDWSFNSNSNESVKDKTSPIGNTASYYGPFNSYSLLDYTVDFSVPWNLYAGYTLSYNNILREKYTSEVTQSINIRGDFNLTPRWKIGFFSGYDFDLKDFTITSFDIYLDLHCWEIGFKWIPFGYMQGWEFKVNVKANSLKDVLKHEKKVDVRYNNF